ncbi:MAG: phosphoribosylformylglycinamidine cyclo-ligase [Nitrosomonadales bacterium]
MTKNNKSISYKDSGVDIVAGDNLVEKIKPAAKRTARPELMGSLGGFGSMFEVPKKFKNPVLVSGTDGVGTKLKLAIELNRHDTIGQDLVGMCVNDILVQGAEPLFFLDYYACGKLSVDQASSVINGIAYGCELAGCSLVGGETAEMPGMYKEGDYDLAGFAVGAVEKNLIITGEKIREGNKLLGISSSGPHSNGYSLIRKILEVNNIGLGEKLNNTSLADHLMAPTKIYVKHVLELLQTVTINGMAHITGGGITENLPRVFNENLAAEINIGSWHIPEIFKWIKEQANIDNDELLKTFNSGIGMILIVNENDVNQIKEISKKFNENIVEIGKVVKRKDNENQVIYI